MIRDEEDQDSRLVGTTVDGKYRVERLIGRGGMGAVYEATNVGIGKRVALKFLDRDATRRGESVTRFQREAEAASAVESAHIVQIFDSGTTEEGRPFLVMELLKGEDLRAILRREGRLDLASAVHIVGQSLRALARAHAAGIVHRDLKPDNVFVCRRDDDPMFVKLVDFGISKITRNESSADTLTRRGTVLGTAFYMSPEQAQAFPDIDGRTDLFSAGAILFEALAGRPPHVGSAYEAVLIDICTKDAPDLRSLAPEVPDGVAEVVAKALARDRANRFQSASEMYDALATSAPGLLRTGGLGVPGGPLAPISAPSRTPSDGAGVSTEEGTAVRPSDPSSSRAQARRTIVAGVVAALAAFTITVLLMAQRHPDGPAAGAGSAAPPSAEPASASPTGSAPTVGLVASSATVSAATSADAAAPPPKPKPAATRPPSAKPSPSATPAPSGTAQKPAPHPTGVATGLELDTHGP